MSVVAAPVERRVPASWLTPRTARSAAIHRWFVFPHSYSPQLVSWLIDELEVERGGRLLDPFCGAGTTLLEAEQHGLTPVGTDLLPLAVIASRAKLGRPSSADLRKARHQAVCAARTAAARTPSSKLLSRAFTPTAYGRLTASLATARGPAGDCVQLAVLATASRFSSLIADGGWLRESAPRLTPRHIPEALDEALAQMEVDAVVERSPIPAEINQADARNLPVADQSIDVVITSPPYPNRHDYTRVFAVELELGFALGESVKRLRYDAIRSHPEAKPFPTSDGYAPPKELPEQVSAVARDHPDPRIPRMLSGYFEDLWLVLRELARVVRPGGVVAMVVGNARYSGVLIPVDLHLASLAERAGFSVIDVALLRLRGNSAQQMAAHGRQASRESAVLLQR